LGQWLGIISLCLGLVATIASGLSWLSGRARKTYAAERDFGHLRAGQLAMAEALSQGLEDIEDVKADLNEIRRLLEIRSLTKNS
jgi:hypothetical protein